MLIDDVRADRIGALRAKDGLRKDLLGTLIGEATKVNKNPSDAEFVAVVKKFINNANECIRYSDRLPDVKSYIDAREAEIAILNGYLPKQLSTVELTVLVHQYIKVTRDAGEGQVELKDVMKFLKENYAGLYDGAVAAKITKELLTG